MWIERERGEREWGRSEMMRERWRHRGEGENERQQKRDTRERRGEKGE